MVGFRSWVPESVFSAGGGRSSVEAGYASAPVMRAPRRACSDSSYPDCLSSEL